MKEKLRKFVRIWMRMDLIGSIVLLGILVCLVVSFVGIPKDLEETVDACVYTESGETFPCQLRITGEVTTYPFRKNKEYVISVYREHILVSEMHYNTAKQRYAYCQTYRFTGIKDIEQDVLLVEMDLQTLYPEMESQRCMIVSPVLKHREAMEIINSVDYDEYKNPFSWVSRE